MFPKISLDPKHCGYFENNQNLPIVVRRKVYTEEGQFGYIKYRGKNISVKRNKVAGNDLAVLWETYKNE